MANITELPDELQDQAEEAINGLVEEAEGLSGGLRESASYLRCIASGLLEHADRLESEDR